MADNLNCNEDALRRLTAPYRNRYFYGKLLDAFHFEMEQNYFNSKRWLINRLTLGAGVVCGLEVVATNDGSRLQVAPGMAVDRLGREVVVPEPSMAIDPRELSGACGQLTGDRVEGEGMVTLCLAYHECEAEPVPVLVGDCDTERGCAPSTVRERYKLLVKEGAAPAIEPACGMADLFTPPVGEEGLPDIHSRVVERVSQACPEVDGDACVVLAQIDLPAEGQAITPEMIDLSVRPVVYTNELLLEMLLCLAERVAHCCRSRILRYVSGDAQQALPEEVLEGPLVVEVVNGEASPVAQEPVTLSVHGGGGGVGDGTTFAETYTVNTQDDGRAEASWKLGPNPGLNTVEAFIASGSRVVFHALAREMTVSAPVVKTIWPPNAVHLTPESEDELVRKWFEQFQKPHLEITFDREMAEDNLAEPQPWLRLWQIRPMPRRQVQVRRIQLAFEGPPERPILEEPGYTVLYTLLVESFEELLGTKFLIQIRAENGIIVDTGTPPQLLDADFAGSELTKALLDRIWDVEEQQLFGQQVWDRLADTGNTLPSGDGEAGGLLHTWFGVSLEG